MADEENYTEAWKLLFTEECQDWDPFEVQRLYNIPNDRDDVDKEEYESSLELVDEINALKRDVG